MEEEWWILRSGDIVVAGWYGVVIVGVGVVSGCGLLVAVEIVVDFCYIAVSVLACALMF